MEGLRYNEGKLRYDLLEPLALEELVKVFTKGAEKYADNNWLGGMGTNKMVASLKRHTESWIKGEDIDPETNCHHMAHAAWNALAIVSYSKLLPQMDTRLTFKLKKPKIGLDLDDVLVDWCKPWAEKFGYPEQQFWSFSYNNKKHFEELIESGEISEFYSKLPAKLNPNDLPGEPHCYVTARSIDPNITQNWLQDNGFPCKPIYTVGFGQSKAEACKKAGIDIFVDDSYNNFLDLNQNGIFTYLYDSSHNRRYDVGNRRIKSLQEIAHLF